MKRALRKLVYTATLIFLFTFTDVPSAFSLAGGISGGGGNVIVNIPAKTLVSTESAELAVETMRANLPDYVAMKRSQYLDGSMPVDQRRGFAAVFDSPISIDQVLNAVPTQILEHNSCRNFRNEKVDGSTVTADGKNICISAFRISRKVDRLDIDAQATALLMHEYSELVGLDENQAIQVQMATLRDRLEPARRMGL